MHLKDLWDNEEVKYLNLNPFSSNMNSEGLDSRAELINRCRDPEDVRERILRSIDDAIYTLGDELVERMRLIDKRIESARGKAKSELEAYKLDSQRSTKRHVNKLKRQSVQWKNLVDYTLHKDGSFYCVGGYCMHNAPLDWRNTLVQGRRSGPIVIVDNLQNLKDIGDQVVYVAMCGVESTGHSVYFTKKDPVKKVNVIYYMQKTGVEIDENLQIGDENYEDPRIKLVMIDDPGKNADDYSPLTGIFLITPYKKPKGKSPKIRSDTWQYLKKGPFIQLRDMFEYERLLRR